MLKNSEYTHIPKVHSYSPSPQNPLHHLLHPLRTPPPRNRKHPLLYRTRPQARSMQSLCREKFGKHVPLRTLCFRAKQHWVPLLCVFEFCFHELEVSDTFKKFRPFFRVDENDGNSSRVVEGVCLCTATKTSAPPTTTPETIKPVTVLSVR